MRVRWFALAMVGLAVIAASVVVNVMAPVPAAAAIGGAPYVGESATNSVSVKSATAHCPGGMRVFGGGGRLTGDNHRVVLVTLNPFSSSSGDGYSATAAELPGGYSGSWSVRAYAICANAISGMQIVVASTTDRWFKEAVATCPSGKVPVGAGGAVGGSGAVSMTSIWPEEFHRRVSVSGQDIVGDGVDAPVNYAVFAWAICAPKPAGYKIKPFTYLGDTATQLSGSSSCTGGQTTLGGGFYIEDSTGTAHLESMYTQQIFVAARASRVNTWSTFYLQPVAICAD